MTPETVAQEFDYAEAKKAYDNRVDELVRDNGWTPRKARRALNAHSRKVMKKFRKSAAKNISKGE